MLSKNIGIGLLFISHRHITGGFVYTKNLLEQLFKIDNNNQYYLFLNKKEFKYFKKIFITNKNVHFVVIDIRKDIYQNPLRCLKKLIAKISKDENLLENIIREEIQHYLFNKNISIFFSPSQTIYPKGLKEVKLLSTIYDLQHIYHPENFSSKNLKDRAENDKYAIENSEHLIAISGYTKTSVLENYKIDPSKISVIYLAANLPQQTEPIPLPTKFIFYPAAFWPHKNHELLIESLANIQSKFPDLHLVFSGSLKSKEFMKKLTNAIKKNHLEEKIHFLGFIEDNNLAYVYKKATVLVYPSSFEGFGIPIIEAFENGLPVIAADNTSLSEVVNSAGLLFQTHNIDQLSTLIENVISNQKLREDLIKKGFERAKQFSWTNTAKQTLNILNHLGD